MNKRLLLSVIFLICCFFNTYAAYIVAFPVTVNQPDGTVISCYASGDEFYNWLHDENNFTIIQNDEGFYCYAVKNGDNVIASQYIVGTIDPAAVGIIPGISISAEAKTAIRKQIIDNTPDITAAKEYKASKSSKNFGTMNNLVVYIKFADQTNFPEDTTHYWTMFNKTDDNSYQSLKNYFEQVSYGKLSIASTFYPLTQTAAILSYTDSHNREYYMPYNAVTAPTGYQNDNQRGDREFTLLKNALEYIEHMVPADLDIDYNNDGMVDNVVFIIRGATTAWSTLLWPHRWSLYGENAYIHGKRVWDFNFQLEEHLNSSQSSVLCHEMFHSLSAPDLYRYSDNTITPIGQWDVMGSNGNPAQSMAAYMKYKYGGWLDEIPEITEPGVYTLNTPWSETNNMYKLAAQGSSNEFFLFEFRNKDHLFESTLPGEGLLIYRVNSSINGNAGGPPDELYLFRPGGYNTTTNGTISQAYFSANSGRTEFSNETNPPCFLMDDQPGGIQIINITSVGNTISFEVPAGNFLNADFYASNENVTIGCGVDFFTTTFHPIDEWFWEFEDGIPATSTQANPTGITFSQSGLKTIKLTVTNSIGSFTEIKESYINVSDQSPEADFYSNTPSTCVGNIVELFDNSNRCPIEWSWSFEPNTVEFVNGTNSNSQNPVVIFNSIADYNITLIATNINGSTTVVKEKFITTLGINLANYSLDFENVTSLESLGITVTNPDNNITWDLINIPMSQGTNTAIYMNFFNYNTVSQRDYFTLPLVNIDSKFEMHFKHAYAMRTTYSDTLIISISTDCGETWQRLASYHEDGNNNFATVSPQSSEFIPADESNWCDNSITDCNIIDLSAYNGKQAIIRFESYKTMGNNLYIDDIHFVNKLGIDDYISNEIINVYPNPSSGIYNIDIANNDSKYDLYVYDIVGNLICYSGNNTNRTQINISDKKSGIYFVKVISNNINKTVKIIKN
ncbi:MAG: M6 family metalloprotease domain-containing protein [Bacteroidales bacterium]|jgi:M6 family metalloprotease-like protein|nr:M6 family metalloprotease domain-containing protein [Bacteroidales bacterium]